MNYREQFLNAKTDEQKKEIILNFLKINPNITYENFSVKNNAPCNAIGKNSAITRLFGNLGNAKKLIGINKSYPLKVPKHKTLKERIDWYILNAEKINNCLIPKRKLTNGYIIIRFDHKQYYLHRLICTKKYNLNYEDKNWVARHSEQCIEGCCNENHLINGTSQENARDCRTYSKNTKLNIEQVKEVKKELINIYKYKTKKEFDLFFANKFNSSKSSIEAIRLNRTWKDI